MAMKRILAFAAIPLLAALLFSGCGRSATSASEVQQSNEAATTTSTSVASTTSTTATTSTTSSRTLQDTATNRRALVATVRSMMSQNDSNSVSDIELETAATGACLKMEEPGGMNSLIELLKGHQSAGRTGAYLTQFAIFYVGARLFCPWNFNEWSTLAKQT